jgi:hypothetical protein
MAFKTLAQLREYTRQRADVENDGRHTDDAEVDALINASVEFLHSMLVDGTDGTLFAKNASGLTKLGDNSYQLPSDFSQLVSLDIKSGGVYLRSQQADPQDYAQLTLNSYGGQNFYNHLLRWNTAQGRGELFIFPAPTNTIDIAVQYIPEPPVLSTDSDTLNWPTFWYQWVVLDAAIQISIKEESDPSALLGERNKVEKRIRDHIRSMTPTRIKQIRRVKRGYYDRFRLPPINGGS